MRMVWTMNFDFNDPDLLSSNDVIRQLEPTGNFWYRWSIMMTGESHWILT
jgi:hypothetical protein